MDTYQGRCQFCGEEQPIMAENQEMADNIVSGSCKCSGATIAKRQAILMQRINYIAAASHNDTFSPLSESEVRMLRQGGDRCASGEL